MGLNFVLGFLAALILASCAGFSYRYYGMDQVIFDHGVLLGPSPNDDLPFSKCAPSGGENLCVVMFAEEFFAFKREYLDLRDRLEACEKKI